eukprot:TRINITY_DN239_c0_g1_i2.p1 TRINITY_DN239_c0_g1~~TRINITY_DN239_c0_g1_i2.p1  ORF type:complete len:715 (-),score=294.06 TRINITY_DN239_c0_g1_i2:23-2101(-)
MTEVRTKQSQFEEARLRMANKGRKSVPARTTSKTLTDVLEGRSDSSSSLSSSSSDAKKRASLPASSSSFQSILQARNAADPSGGSKKGDKGMSGANKLALSLLIASILIVLGFNVDLFSPIVQFFVPYDPNDKDTAVFYLGNAVGSALFWLAVIRYFTASSSSSSSSSSSFSSSSAPQKLPRSDALVASAPIVADPKTPVTKRGTGAGKTTPFQTKRPVSDGDETETDEESSTPLVREKKSMRALEFTPTPHSIRPARNSINPMMNPISLANNQNNQKASKNVFPQRDPSTTAVPRGFGSDTRDNLPVPVFSNSKPNVGGFRGAESFSTFKSGIHDVENAYKPTKRRSTLIPGHMNHLQFQAPLPSSSSFSNIPSSLSTGTLANQFQDQRAGAFGQQNQDHYFNQGGQGGQFQGQYAPPHHFPPQVMQRQMPPANAFQQRPIPPFQQQYGPSPVAPRAQQPFYAQPGYGQQSYGYGSSSSSSSADPSSQIQSMGQFNAYAHGVSSPYVPAKSNSPAVVAPTSKGSTDPNDIHPGLMDFVYEHRTRLLPNLLGFYLQYSPVHFTIPPYNIHEIAPGYVWEKLGRILNSEAFEDTKPPAYPPDDQILLYWFLTIITAHINGAFANRYVEKPDRSSLSFVCEGQAVSIGFQNKTYKFPGSKKDQLVNSINAFIFIYDIVLKKSPPISPVIFRRPL